MNCSNCEHPLIPGARFCGKCGTPAPESNVKPEAKAPEKTARRIDIISDVKPKSTPVQVTPVEPDQPTDQPDPADEIPGVPELADADPIPEDVSVTAPKPIPELTPPKATPLLEGPHPALVKAQREQREQKQSDSETDTVNSEADEAAEPVSTEKDAADKFFEDTYDDYEVSIIDPPKRSARPAVPETPASDSDDEQAEAPAPATSAAPAAAVHPDIPGPKYPFGNQMSDKNYFTTFLLSFFLGIFGADRFYTGHYGYAFFKLFTFGGLSLLSYIDTILLVANLRRDRYGRRLYGRDKDFRASLWILVGFTVLSLVLFGIFLSQLPPEWTEPTI